MMPSLSQKDCLGGRGSEVDKMPPSAYQELRYDLKWLSVAHGHAVKTDVCRSSVLARKPNRQDVLANAPP